MGKRKEKKKGEIKEKQYDVYLDEIVLYAQCSCTSSHLSVRHVSLRQATYFLSPAYKKW